MEDFMGLTLFVRVGESATLSLSHPLTLLLSHPLTVSLSHTHTLSLLQGFAMEDMGALPAYFEGGGHSTLNLNPQHPTLSLTHT